LAVLTVRYGPDAVPKKTLELVSKLAPLIVTVLPGAATPGVKLKMDGGPTLSTWNAMGLTAVPAAVVTLTFPLAAPAGTCATICVADADWTGALTPLNLTVLSLTMVANPVPLIVTVVPAIPLPGCKAVIASGELLGTMAVRLPASS
jgi:hypothetical protein